MDMETFFIVQRGEDIGRRYDLDTVQLTVGRGSDNDMVLNDPMVSRYHAVIKRQSGRYVLIDLGSANPVVVNDQVLEVGLPHPLSHRDVIFIGKTVFSFQSREAGARASAVRPDDSAARKPAERQTAQPMTPTMETPLPRAGSVPPHSAMPPTPVSQDDDSGKTMMGPLQRGDPRPAAQPSFAPPAPEPPRTSPEPATNPALRTPPGQLPPLPPLGGQPSAQRVPGPPGGVTQYSQPGGGQQGPIGGPPPAGGRMEPPARGPVIGTPPDDDDGDSPTVFIPRERH